MASAIIEWLGKMLIKFCLLVVFLWIINCHPGYAAQLNMEQYPGFLPTPALSSFKNVGAQLDLSEFGLEY